MTADAGRADRDAAAVLAGHLRGRLAAGIDPALVADHLVALLREHGWRPIPRPQPITAQGRKDPATAKAGAARVRAELPNPKETR